MLPPLPPFAAEAILYAETPIHWTDWVQTWQLDHDGKGHAPLLPLRVRLVPRMDADENIIGERGASVP